MFRDSRLAVNRRVTRVARQDHILWNVAFSQVVQGAALTVGSEGFAAALAAVGALFEYAAFEALV